MQYIITFSAVILGFLIALFLKPQKVILMHDGGLDRSNTVKALELMLHELMMQGYTVLPYCTQDGQAIKN